MDESANSFIVGFSALLHTSADTFASELVAMVIGFAAIGTLAMAFVSILKKFRIRAIYYRYRLRTYLLRDGSRNDVNTTEDLIVALSAGEIWAFYEQDLNAIVSGIVTARAQVLAWLTSDDQRTALRIMVGPEGADDVEEYINHIEAQREGDATSSPTISNANQLSALIGRLSALSDARFAGLKISIDYWWRQYMQGAAMLLSAALILAIGYNHFVSPAQALAYSFLGGLFAPFAHDVVKTLRGARVAK